MYSKNIIKKFSCGFIAVIWTCSLHSSEINYIYSIYLDHVPSRAQTRYKYSYDGKSSRDYYLFPNIAVKLVMDSIPTRPLQCNKTTILLITL